MTITICPKCGVEFDNYSKWGPRRYCTRKCANSRPQSTEIRERKSKKLQKETPCQYCNEIYRSVSGAKTHEKSCQKNPRRQHGAFYGKAHKIATKKAQGKKNAMGLKIPTSLLDMSKRTTSKVMKRLGIGCFNCGWNQGSCDVHHILPVSKGGSNDNENLTYICPNCHRLAHEGKLTSFVSVAEKVGDVWRNYYFAHK